MKSSWFIVLGLAVVGLFLTSPAAQADDGFEKIFNGKDLDGWYGREDLWSVEDGVITGRTSEDNPLKGNTFLIWGGGDVSDFELMVEYRVEGLKSDFGNSGIQYRSKIVDKKEFVVGGYQADIDNTMKYAGINYEEKGRGILAQRGQRVTIDADGEKSVDQFGDTEELGKKIKKGDWNQYRVVAKGNTVSHYINGQLMSEVIDDQKGKAASEGVLAFQIHRGDPMLIQFRNVMLKQSK